MSQRDHITELEEDEFLAGPERYARYLEGNLDEDLLDLDDVFAKTPSEILRDYPVTQRDLFLERPSLLVPSYSFAETHSGTVLLNPRGKIAGVYLGCDVSLCLTSQGYGLGAELIAERALRDDSLPTWDLDRPAYTFAGAAAHRAAWRLLQDQVFVARKTGPATTMADVGGIGMPCRQLFTSADRSNSRQGSN
ncbi:hypothetical protein [Microvirga tunisiensis]|uniref:Uncharacterized protein n=1 Tax=Microvirga tunisiensis TaxID=2108360 RepID=A0A5N7MQR1_9HYPH|nr:hypothetical protein [Microvirga tunisiensis]MPR09220.1 hypothetical protein [Microvirga tunisiensis]MPR28789.1 hypothetical protein [Microvirga tunisiensis]